MENNSVSETISNYNPNTINQPDINGETQLMIAASIGDITLVKHCLDNGADPYAQDKRGRTALHYSMKSFNLDEKLVLLLGQDRAMINTQNELGNTPFHGLFLIHSKPDIMLKIAREFYKRGGDINIQNNKGETPAILSCYERDSALSRGICDLNPDINLQDIAGETFSMHMIKHFHDVDKKLLGEFFAKSLSKIDFSLKDRKGANLAKWIDSYGLRKDYTAWILSNKNISKISL